MRKKAERIFLALAVISGLVLLLTAAVAIAPFDYDLWFAKRAAGIFFRQTQMRVIVTEAPSWDSLSPQFLDESRVGGVKTEAVEFQLVRRERKLIAWGYGRIGVNLLDLPSRDMSKIQTVIALGQPISEAVYMGYKRILDLPNTGLNFVAGPPDQSRFEAQYQALVKLLGPDGISNPIVRYEQPGIYWWATAAARFALTVFTVSVLSLFLMAAVFAWRKKIGGRREKLAAAAAAEIELRQELTEAKVRLLALWWEVFDNPVWLNRIEAALAEKADEEGLRIRRKTLEEVGNEARLEEANRLQDRLRQAELGERFCKLMEEFDEVADGRPDPMAENQRKLALSQNGLARQVRFVLRAIELQEEANQRDRQSQHKKDKNRARV